MYDLYIANKNYSSWSLRPWILLKALHIPFSEHLSYFGTGSNWQSFRAFSPTGRVPSLHDGSITVWDSLAITEYLAERHVGIWPTDPEARAWARSVAAEMHSGFGRLRDRCTMNCGIRVDLGEIDAPLREDISRITEIWDEGLSLFGGPFLAGANFTAADAFYAPVAFRVQTYGLKLSPTANAYAEHLLALPAMQDWYDAALKETQREQHHEDDARAAGKWTADYRAKG